ncbi:uncharacterized protein [Rutidosis leptorrhynchoides]|uniref:uncharacterized protein n=1 Tax=Rutidosis leptorrhynchoides TaxID=125765 RepID=UPI003A99D350
MDPNGQPILNEEGNPINHGPPVNQNLLNDPNDTPMWNARLVAPTMIALAITKPPIEAENWKIEGNFFTLIKDTYFQGLIDENPLEHIQHFNDLCDIYKYKDVTDNAFKLRAFPFTLQGEVKVWLRSLPYDSIRTFQDLTNEFINHFFPPSKVERLPMEINGFTQRGDKSLYDAWVRFKKMLRACPPQGLTKKEYINSFYRGCNALMKQYLDSSSGGVFMYKSPNAAEILLEDISVNTYEWAPPPRDLTRKSVEQIESDNGQVTLASLNNQFQTYGKELKKIQQTIVTMQSNTTNPNHNQVSSSNSNNTYAQVNSIDSTEEDQTEYPQVFTFNVEGDTFDFDEALEIDTIDYGVFKFSEDSNDAVFIPYQVKSVMSMEDNESTCKELKGNFEQIKLGRVEKEKRVETLLNAKEQKNKVEVLTTSTKEKMKHRSHILNHYLLHIQRMWITLMAKKGEVEQASTVFLKKECDGILKKCNLPPKMGDPGPFLMPCNVNGSKMLTSLADSGESINFMPYFVYKKLGLGDLSPTTMGVKLIDQSISSSVGISEDLIIKVGDKEFPIDFVIVDIKEDPG